MTIYFLRATLGDEGGTDLYTVPAAGGEAAKVLTLEDTPLGIYGTLHWAHDGTALYFTRYLPRQEDATNGVWRYDLADASVRQVLGLDEERGIPMLRDLNTQTGKALVYYPKIQEQFASSGMLGFALLDLASGELTSLAPAADGDLFPRVLGATLSPDGSKVLFSYGTADSHYYVVVRDLVAGEGEELVENVLLSDSEVIGASRVRGADLAWATDDTVIVVAVNDGVLLTLAPRETE
jgi:hypothetical protein